MKIRPTFEILSEQPPEEIRSRLKRLTAMPERCDASVLRGYAVLRIRPEDQHYWSPQLNVDWDKGDEGTRVKGRFGPRPSVWTLFAGFYLLSIFVGAMGLIFGLAQRQLDLTPWALWLVPPALIFLGVAYTIALSGQKLGHDQMDDLEKILNESINEAA